MPPGPAPATSRVQQSEAVAKARRSPALLRPHSLVSPLICFAIALIACLCQNLSKSSLESVWLFDSGHYLQSSQKLAEVFRALCRDFSPAALSMSCWEMKELLLCDGPILPSLGAAVCLLLNKTSALMDARPLIVLQAVLHAISAALVCLLSRRLCTSGTAGLTAGVIWALYPPALVGAGKFLSETLTTAVTLSIVTVLSLLPFRQQRGRPALVATAALVTGVLTGSVMLTKPALAATIYLVNLAALCLLRRGRPVFIVCLVVAALLTVLPWAAFTKVTTGSISFSNQRMPTLNVVTGLDPETDGWGCLLEAPFVSMFPHNDDAFATALGIIKSYPGQSLNLTLRKIPRLWSDPWNDYRQKCLAMTISIQQWWHRVLLFFGICGITLFLSSNGGKSAQQHRTKSSLAYPTPRLLDRADDSPLLTSLATNFIGYASLLLIGGHLVYLLVVANLRYGFTAMPFLVIFASFAVTAVKSSRPTLCTTTALATTCLLFLPLLNVDLVPLLSAWGATVQPARLIDGLVKTTFTLTASAAVCWVVRARLGHAGISPAGILAICGFALFAAAVILANATTDSVITEWPCALANGSHADRKIVLKGSPGHNPDWALLIFDGDSNSDQAVASINGRRLWERPKPLYAYTGNQNELGGFQIYSSLLRQPIERFRHWRALPIPLSQLNLAGPNTVTIEAASGACLTVYGSYQPDQNRMKIPSLTQQSATRLLGSANNLDVRLIDLRTVDASRSQSSLTAASNRFQKDLSPAFGLQTGQYHILIALGYRTEDSGTQPSQVRASTEIRSDTQVIPCPDFRKHVVRVF
jgi:hypothetical protein